MGKSRPRASVPLRRRTLLLGRIFGTDVRSLACFRIGLGLLLLTDLAIRASDLTAHYTDQGLFPRDALFRTWDAQRPSLHVITGSAPGQACLFALGALAALALTLGYRTRLATVLCWALTVSLFNRNTLVLNAGDKLLSLLLFWSMFLPLGASYSLDRALEVSSSPRSSRNKGAPVVPPDRASPRIVSVASAALLLQIACVYWFTAALKDHAVWRQEFTAVWYALQLTYFKTPLTDLLAAFPALLTALTAMTLWVEALGPLAAFSPVKNAWMRGAAVVTFIMLHAGFMIFLRLGLFSPVCMVAWLAFLPTEFWEALLRRLHRPRRQELRIYFDSDCGFCRRMVRLLRTFLLLPPHVLHTAQSEKDIHAEMVQWNSWVVVDFEGTHHHRYDALVRVVRDSIVFAPLAIVLGLAFLRRAGNQLYRMVARHRSGAWRVISWLPERPVRLTPSLFGQLAAGLALTYIFLYNWRSLERKTVDSFMPSGWTRPGRFLRLDQDWRMFAPKPSSSDQWFAMAAVLADGRTVDLLRDGAPLSWDNPGRHYWSNLGKRTTKLLLQTPQITRKGSRYRYARSRAQDVLKALTRQRMEGWNQAHPESERIVGAAVYVIRQQNTPTGTRPAPTLSRLYQTGAISRDVERTFRVSEADDEAADMEEGASL